MSHNQFDLLKTRRFLPLFITQFLGAFNDNVFKNALVILITYVVAEKAGLNPQIMVTVAAGIFILPFFLLSATAGQLADKYEKAFLIRIIKFVEILLMIGATIGFYMENVWFLMTILFLMGAQSTFFGPIKYGILPEKIEEDELIGGNGLIEAGTFISILLGTLVGGLLILAENGILMISGMVILIALLGWVSSFYIPKGQPASPQLKVDYNFLRETWEIVSHAKQNREIFLSILGISWFWLVGATFLAQFPTYSKDIIGGNEELVTLFLSVFTIGVGIGSLLCNKLLNGEVEATFVPLGIIGVTVFTVDLYFASQYGFINGSGELMGAGAFLSHISSWRILGDMFMISVSSGIYIVPLYAIIQARSEPDYRSRIIASNNILNALFMVISAVGTVLMLGIGFDVAQVFLTIALLNAAVAVYACKLLPVALLKSILYWIFSTCYKVEVKGLENYKKIQDEKVIIIANHTSFLDGTLLATYLPTQLRFAINTRVAQHWLIKPFLGLMNPFPLDPTNPMAAKSLIETIKDGNHVVIFPEGRITVTGALMKVYEGSGMIADKSGAHILPVRIDGAQYTPFSRLKGKVRTRWFPKITLTFLEPKKFNIPENIKGRARRRTAGAQLYDMMAQMMFQASNFRQPLFQSLLDAKAVHGAGRIVAEDIQRTPITYGGLVTKCFVLGKPIANITQHGEHIGILLPNMVSTLVTFFALQAYGRVPAMLNFSVGKRNILSACETACIKTVFTSRKFIETAKLEETAQAIEEAGIQLIYLEDFAKTISVLDKALGFLAGCFPQTYYSKVCRDRNPDSPALVLFTSGSEGTPKGVILSHANIMSNIYQTGARIDFGPNDVIFNALPVFHSFGMTGGTLLPVLSGAKTFFYPSPLHYRVVPELSYDANATIMFGTDTFLSGYARYGHPYDFYSLRYVFAGAEKLKEETRKLWSEKFGVRIFEGYGATETSPILAVNTPMQSKPGTVGRLVPGIEYKLEEVPGIDEGGRLLVSGPNIMLGYLLASAPGKRVPPEDGWYDTGDIVDIDDEGFIRIKGRAKRFAKVGGEMISLTAVEDLLSKLWPNHGHAIVAIPDEKKGEQLVLVTENKDAQRQEITEYARNQGLSELGLPKTIIYVDKIPLLGTGKTDYVTTQEIVANHSDV
jgi:acyl-[acyl-carrier-protein]-phospholipid O-acyltransferase / long-chain-fatty-acid--[acyl-carrier-protein] ligase